MCARHGETSASRHWSDSDVRLECMTRMHGWLVSAAGAEAPRLSLATAPPPHPTPPGPGRQGAIVGPSGAGKSTVFHLLQVQLY